MLTIASLLGIVLVIIMTLFVVAVFGGLVILMLYLVNRSKNKIENNNKKDNE